MYDLKAATVIISEPEMFLGDKFHLYLYFP